MSTSLVTYVVFGYNQEQYIREAAMAALAQSYSPLQVILSDDGSSDRTFEIMQDVAASYQGPHSVRLNRVQGNRGFINHINEVAKLVSGEWVIVNAGDDISHRDRAAILMKAVSCRSQTVRAAFSDAALFAYPEDCYSILQANLANGADTNKFQLVPSRRVLAGLGFVYCGATWAYHRDCFEKFEPLWTDLNTEDRVLPMRAFLLGEIVHVRQCLVARRVVPNSLGQRNTSLEEIAPDQAIAMEEVTLNALIHDISVAVKAGLMSSEEATALNAAMRRTHEMHEYLRAHYRRIPRARMIDHIRALTSICFRFDWLGAYQYLRIWAGLWLRSKKASRGG